MSQIVLISGKQGSGKSTIQNALIAAFNSQPDSKAIGVNFADPLYEMAEAVRDVAERYGIPKKMPKDGQLLQLIGTEWGRNTIDSNIWIRCLRSSIALLNIKVGLFAYTQSLVVVGDCRFRNEFDGFPDALRIRLYCPESLRKNRCSAWRENTQHQSEIDLDEYEGQHRFDFIFDTDKMPVNLIVEKVLSLLKSEEWKDRR